MKHTAENTPGLAWKAIDAAKGANILKRTIEHLCCDQWSEDRADALEVINQALEQCFADEVLS